MAAVERILVASRARSGSAVIALAVVSLVWIGALLGVSFLATPVKFLAPTLTLPVALDVGRQTFHWFNRVEIVLTIALLASALAYDLPRRRKTDAKGEAAPAGGGLEPPYATYVAAFMLGVVALQAFWLLPQLDARVEVIVQGGVPQPSSLHDVYVLLEAAKLGALVGGAWHALASLRRPDSVAA